MRKKLFAAAIFTALVLSACGNQAGEADGNSVGSSGAVSAGGTSDTETSNSRDETSGAPEPEVRQTGESESDDGKLEQDEGIVAQQEGSAGMLQVTLPEGWTYDACPEGSDQLRVGDYGIHFYPEDASEGFIELCYVDFFGVCGMGLEEKKVMLAGDEAYIGTYDHGDNWDFVSFHGANEGIVALTYAVEGWWPEYGEQTLEILETVSLNTASTTACGTNLEPAENSEEDSVIEELGLSLDIKEYTGTGATLIFRQSGGNPTRELTFDGELEPGEYRIRKDVDDFRKSGDYDKRGSKDVYL